MNDHAVSDSAPRLLSLPAVKEHVVSQVREQADAMLGMSMTFTLFEWVKESAAELMANQQAAPAPAAQLAEEVEELTISQVSVGRSRVCGET